MTFDDIKRLIAPDESRHLELKKTTGELKDGMHSACAFLNTEGGWLIFGISPNSKKIIGQNVTDATQREIAQALSGIEPAVYIPVEYIDVPDKPDSKVIAMHFDGRVPNQAPYTFHGKPYIKLESTTQIMPREIFEERIRACRPETYSWESLPSNRTLDDLNHESIRGSVRMGVEGGRLPESAMYAPIEEILDRFKFLTDGKPNNGAIMLFSKDVSDYLQLKIRLARFVGTNKNAFIDNQQVEGNFFDLLDAGMAFFFKHLDLSGTITGWQREEKLEVPVAALRETLINALCHKQNEKVNLSIGIAIYDDRVEIANPGILPPQITPVTIKLPHDSYPYNPSIAQFLYRTTWLENWGSGAQRIIDACKADGVPEPEWEVRGSFVVVTFKRKKYLKATEQETEQATEQVTEQATEQVQKLLNVLDGNTLSVKEIMEIMGLSHRPNFITTYLNPAIELGLIEPLFPDQPRHPKQKYRRKK